MRALAFFFIFLTGYSYSAEVMRVGASLTIVAVSHDYFRKWAIGDPLCIFTGNTELACGTVVKVSSTAGIVKLDAPNNSVARGQLVRLTKRENTNPLMNILSKSPPGVPPAVAAKPPERKPSAVLLQSVPKDGNASTYYHNFSGGVSVGNGFYFPLLHFQRALVPQFALGIMPTYFSVSTEAGSISALSAIGTANFYGNDFFRGLWVQLGGGAAFLSTSGISGDQQSTSLVSLLTVGWRGYWDLGLNIGVCGGFQYLHDPNFTSVRISGSGLQPLALVDVGINF